MRIVTLFNPAAGGGEAEAAARRVNRLLQGAGHEPDLVSTRADAAGAWLDDALDGAGALLVVGGDGAVRLAADPAIRTRTPLYHVPCGTANLFAHEFGMRRGGRTLLAALQHRCVRRVDAGTVNGERFVLMVSIGFDAEVVHDLAARRGASISSLSYLRPMLRQMARWRPPRLEVTVDGKALPLEGTGMIVVANCRGYMWGLNPARRADMTDGRLDIAYLPVRSRGQLLGWIGRCALGRQEAHPRFVASRGRAVTITCPEPQRIQLDGDPPAGGVGSAMRELDIELEAGVLPVLAVPPR